jgi:hypothetical protein
MNFIDHARSPYLFTVADARSAACRVLRLCLVALVWAALLYLTPPAMADLTQASISKLSASDPVGSAGKQGFAVAVSANGSTAIIGAPFDNGGGDRGFSDRDGTAAMRRCRSFP